MRIAILENFTDYFSRKVIRYELSSDYYTYVGSGHYEIKTGVNFIPGDNLSTELVVNDMKIQPNYLLAMDDVSYAAPQSRWYVLKADRLVGGQWRLSLRRDVIADNLKVLKDAPIYVEKATLPESDPMILNSEGILFNKIKVEEKLLKDKLGCAWLVGYIARSTGAETINSSLPAPNITSTTIAAIASDANMTEAALSAVLNVDGEGTQSQFFEELRLRYGAQLDNFCILYSGTNQ